MGCHKGYLNMPVGASRCAPWFKFFFCNKLFALHVPIHRENSILTGESGTVVSLLKCCF